MLYKTPGVYLQDTTPPRSATPVLETAVPAFIGYTEKALDAAGQTLTLVPVRVRDLGEYEQQFGGAFWPESYRVYLDTRRDNQVQRVEIQDRFYLYDSLLHYFDNGGGDCYIVSIGNYADGLQPPPVAAGPVADPCAYPMSGQPAPEQPVYVISEWTRFQAGLDALVSYDEPTLVLFPDAVRFRRASDGNPDYNSLGQLQQYALAHCARLQDRFAILDPIPAEGISATAETFRDYVGVENLSYGAAYYPWLITMYDHRFHLRDLHFYDTASGLALAGPEVLSSSQPGASAQGQRKLVDTAVAANAAVDRMLGLAGLTRSQAARVTAYTRDLLRASAQAAGGGTSLTDFGVASGHIRRLAAMFASLDQQVAPRLQDAIEVALPAFNVPNTIQAFIAAEKSPQAQLRFPTTAENLAAIQRAYDALDGTRWLGNQPISSIVAADLTTDSALIQAMDTTGTALARAFEQVYRTATAAETVAEAALFGQHPVLRGVSDAVQLALKHIPPSGTMAGVYVATDAERGVWKAPANVSLRATLGPAIPVDDRTQETLNVHETGKALNVIRSFPGRGAVVWGSRTLLANSLEWRYVPVRRLFIYAEEFLKKATEPLVFEPNDANTWLRLRNMVDAFLRNLWRKGALYGNTAADAYFIAVGIGESMTAQDVLAGRLIVEIGMAAVRPAEYIVVRYACRMEEN
ncbi:MAG: phage tail sheath subtilisin-like domain-containing protein [Bacteroidia bacterium]|nr:phage tail sheath subtilisin-like domain-containing protein [Bacteroidia bacterium]